MPSLRPLLLSLALMVSAALPASATPTYTLTVSAGTAGKHVYPTMFGTNLVYSAVDQSWYPTFLSTFSALGMNALRYPGGTVAEGDFDFHASNVAGSKTDCITLSQFLAAVTANNLTPLLVMPTKRYRTTYGSTGVQDAQDFVRAVNVNHYITTPGDLGAWSGKVGLWEMGNEYYADPGTGSNPYTDPLTRTLYGQIANALGSGMKTVDNTILPIVQFHRGDTTTEVGQIRSQLGAGVMGGCLTHLYPGAGTSFGTVQTQIEDGVAGFGTLNLEPMITEWNMANNSPTGLTLANYLPQLFQAQVEAGVTISTQWPLMWHNNSVDTALAENNGTLRPPGQAYQWLNQCANNRNSVPTASSDPALACLAWKDTSGHLSILVLCGASQSNAQVTVTINGYNGSNFQVTSAKRLSAAGGPGTESSSTPAVVASISPAKNANVLTITTNKITQQEILRIDVTRL